jgi:hypothetical protein
VFSSVFFITIKVTNAHLNIKVARRVIETFAHTAKEGEYCKEGSFVAMVGWLCIDCNEEEEDACANCFLSEDDMDGVSLKKCSRCETVKYCSCACQ